MKKLREKDGLSFVIFLLWLPPTLMMMTTSGCGSSLSCFGSQTGCLTRGDCLMMVSYQVPLNIDSILGSLLTFELFQLLSFVESTYWDLINSTK